MNLRHTLTIPLCLVMLAGAVSTYASRDEYNVPVYKNAEGNIAFVIDTSNVQKALRTISVANRLLQENIHSTIVFDNTGVLLTVVHPHNRISRPSAPIRVITQKQLEELDTLDDRINKLEEILFEETKAESHLNKVWALTARERFTAQLLTFVSFGGAVVVCSECLETYGYDKTNFIHESFTIDPKILQQAITGTPYKK
ncbi:MAG: hypothetical protein MI749_20045 [Desulfovibrionales bacterium]|nr:hypothetical protein [Desulfovibrionales bacterium]